MTRPVWNSGESKVMRRPTPAPSTTQAGSTTTMITSDIILLTGMVASVALVLRARKKIYVGDETSRDESTRTSVDRAIVSSPPRFVPAH
jgi:hypothetical protein